MDENFPAARNEICSQLAGYTLPRWNDLPDLPLYMDQVLELAGRYMKNYPGFDDKGLTASMVNNYVKLGVIPPPVKKRYSRLHLAMLIAVCVLKPCLPIAALRQLMASELGNAPADQLYDRFCEAFERINRDAADAILSENGAHITPLYPLYHAALLAQAEQALAGKLFSARFPQE